MATHGERSNRAGGNFEAAPQITPNLDTQNWPQTVASDGFVLCCMGGKPLEAVKENAI